MKCPDGGGNHDSGNWEQYCEMREQTFAYGGQLTIDGGRNGGVSVKGWNRPDVLVRMRVSVGGEDAAAAKSMASQVRLNASAGLITAAGPEARDNTHWSASFEVMVPHSVNLKATAHNGGITISDVAGDLNFSTHNGGLHITRVNGTVKGQTQNGGVHAKLSGARWEGAGLELTTTNGGVHLEVPPSYSAQLEASTVNGGFKTAFGEAPKGRGERKLTAAMGSGGAPVKVTTRNGGVEIAKSAN